MRGPAIEFLLVGTQMYCNWIRVIPPKGSRLSICLAVVRLVPSGRPMLRNVRDLGAFIGVAIYAVSLASLFRLVRKPDADLPSRQIARPPPHAIKERGEPR